MNCREFESFVQEQMDGAAGALPAGLAGHLADCARCREIYHAARLLEASLPLVQMPTPPAELTHRIVAGVMAQRRARWMWRYGTAATLAAAAAIVLALLPLFNRITPGDEIAPDGDQHQAQHQEKPHKESPAPGGPTLAATVEDARLAMANLGGRLADQTQKQVQQLLSAAPKGDLPPMGMGDPGDTLEPARQSLKNVGATVGTGVQSVTSSTWQAVGYFSRELPSLGTRHNGS